MSVRTFVLSLVSACVLAGCTEQAPGDAAATAGTVTEAATLLEMPHVMNHVLSTAAFKVWNASGTVNDLEQGEFQLRPQTDAEWETVADGGAALAEAVHMLTIPSRVGDEMWRMYSQQLSAAGLEAFNAAEARDPQNQLFQIGSRIDEACTGCHVHVGIEQPAPMPTP
jgi:hypothetical protein